MCNAIQVEDNEYDYTDGKTLEIQLILSKCTYLNYFHIFQITQINRNNVSAASEVQFMQSLTLKIQFFSESKACSLNPKTKYSIGRVLLVT